MGSLKGLCSAHFAEEIAGSHIVATGKWGGINLWMQCSGKDQLGFSPSNGLLVRIGGHHLRVLDRVQPLPTPAFSMTDKLLAFCICSLFCVYLFCSICPVTYIAYSHVLLHIAYKAYTYKEAYMPTCRCMLCLMESGFAVSEDTIF